MDQSDSLILKAVYSFLRALQRDNLPLRAAYLYGSHASGDARPESDIDVALISEEFGDWDADHQRILGPLLASDPRIEPVRFRSGEFTDQNPLAWEIKSKGIRLL